MRHQAIQYDPATGQIRCVLDPEYDCGPEIVNQLNPEAHEAVLAYQKQEGSNRLHEWQLAVTRACGKIPDTAHPEIAAYVKARL